MHSRIFLFLRLYLHQNCFFALYLSFHSPAHLGGSGTSVLGTLLCGRPDHIFGIIGIDAFFVTLF